MRSNRLRILIIAAAVVVVAANVLIRTPATPVAGGPAADAAIDAWFDAERRDAGIPGAAVVVVRNGLVHASGFGTADAAGRPVDAQTPFLLGSVSKGITALAVSQLAERGAVDLDAPVRRYLPEFALADASASDEITVRQLLDQTSGIPTSAGVAPLSEPASSLDARVRELAAVAPVSAPGAAYHYSNANYVVLGRLVEVVSGQAVRGVSPGLTCSSRWGWTMRPPTLRPRRPTAWATLIACGSASRTPTARWTAPTSRPPASSAPAPTTWGTTSQP